MTEENKEHKEKFTIKLARFHDKHYKNLLLIPILILIFCFVYMFVFYSNTGDFIYRDISLTGGTSVTIYDKIDSNKLQTDLSSELESLSIREIYDLVTQEKKAIIIETESSGDFTRQVLEDYLGYKLNEINSSFEFTGSSLSESFFKQLLIAILIAFFFMALVVFVMFRAVIPASAIILSAFADIFMTLVTFNLFGMKMSTAGIVALLMLIGYSVDTDILLTNRVLKNKEDTLNRRIFSSFKTGITMTLTAIVAIGVALFIVKSFSLVLTKIFTIILIGLSFDILNTWITNVSLIKWYVLHKK